MSFGSAAGAARVAHNASDPCPCGSTATYGDCCQPLHQGRAAPSPERLMRSRYTAFVLRDAGYLAQTWHPRTRPVTVDTDAETVWRGLRIIDAPPAEHDEGVVEFVASWRQGAQQGSLRERSRFVHALGRWWYLDAVPGSTATLQDEAGAAASS